MSRYKSKIDRYLTIIDQKISEFKQQKNEQEDILNINQIAFVLNTVLENYMNENRYGYVNIVGSYARGMNIETSDIDFRLTFTEKIKGHYNHIISIFHQLESIFSNMGLVFDNINLKPVYSYIEISRFGFIIKDSNENKLANIDIYIGNVSHSDYDKILNQQMEQVDSQKIVDNINQFKEFLKIIKIYRASKFGLRGLGAIQTILQSGNTAEKGTKIFSQGSFKKALELIYNKGFDKATQEVIPISEAGIKIYDILTQKNYFDKKHFSIFSWNRLVWASKYFIEDGVKDFDEISEKLSKSDNWILKLSENKLLMDAFFIAHHFSDYEKIKKICKYYIGQIKAKFVLKYYVKKQLNRNKGGFYKNPSKKIRYNKILKMIYENLTLNIKRYENIIENPTISYHSAKNTLNSILNDKQYDFSNETFIMKKIDYISDSILNMFNKKQLYHESWDLIKKTIILLKLADSLMYHIMTNEVIVSENKGLKSAC